VLLSILAAGAAVGWYGASYRLVDATLFITWSIVVSATPMYTYLDDTTTPTLREIYGDSVRLVLALIVPISVTLLVCARPIVDFAYGLKDFEPSVVTLQILALSPVFYAISNQAASLALARTNARPMVYAFGAALTLNVVVNLVLIPIWSYKAAAAVTTATEFVLALWCTFATRQLVAGLPWPRLLIAPVAGALAMAAGMLATGQVLWLSLPVGGILYVLVLVGIEVRLLGGTVPWPRRARPGPVAPTEP